MRTRVTWWSSSRASRRSGELCFALLEGSRRTLALTPRRIKDSVMSIACLTERPANKALKLTRSAMVLASAALAA